MNDLLIIALRSVAVYVCIIVFIRIFGKKELSQLSVIDLVFILLISNAVQNAMVGPNSSLEGGLIAAASLFMVNSLLRFLIYRSKRIEKMIKGNPVMLVYEGKVLHEHLEKEQITMEELESAIREHGIDNMKHVNLAILETDGNISVLSDNYNNRTSKKRKSHKAITKNT